MKKISLSVLSISDKLKEKIEEIDSLDIDYIHLDIMDGAFVSAKTWEVSQLKDVLSKVNKKLDVHLMVSDIRKYIDDYSSLNPEYITFHYEATTDPANVLAYIQNKNIKVGYLSMIAVWKQFWGYGTGFLVSFVKVVLLKQKPQEAFPELFFNK